MQLSSETLTKSKEGAIKKIKLQGDDSFIVIKARSKAISARLISQWLAKNPDNLKDKTVAILTNNARHSHKKN